ncbi:MAG TPA: asparagine synthase-related protein [Gemmatimonadales bacterium]|nr:asparagine synthase-related protein [Gemmatimonadales bacterium]
MPHASLAVVPRTGDEGVELVCGVFGKLFGTEQLKQELTPLLAGEAGPLSPARLLALGYRAMGRDWLAAVEGEFATFMYDAARGYLITRTDNIGIGRLHYAHDADRYGVCTDLGTLLSLFRPDEIRPQALREYFFLGYLPAPHTAYQHVYKSLPGHSQILRAHAWQLTDTGRQAAPPFLASASPLADASSSDAEDIVLAALERSIERRLDGATSATVLLTSGYDSTLCAAILKSKCDRVRSFTIGFEERKVNENEDARKIAQHLGLEHHELMFSADRLLDELVEWVQAHAEPWCHPNGLPTYVAHGELRRQGDDRMVFDGSGGDYLFRDFGEFATMVAQLGTVPTALLPRLICALPVSMKRLIFRARDEIPSWRIQQAVKRADWAHRSAADRLIFHNPWKSDDYRQLIGSDFKLGDTQPGREFFAGGSEPMDRYLAYYRSWGFDASVGRAVMESRLQGMRATFPYEDSDLVGLVERMPSRPTVGEGGTRFVQESLTRRFIPGQYFASRKKAMETPIELILASRRGRELVGHYYAAARKRKDNLYDMAVADAARDRFYAGSAGDALKVWSVVCFEVWREGMVRGLMPLSAPTAPPCSHPDP